MTITAEDEISNSSTPSFDVFLSHNSREKIVVERIAEKLKRDALEPWLDKWCLTPSGDWQDELASGLRSSSSCAVFIGPHGVGDWERLEFKLATDRMAKDRNFRVFLVLLPELPEPFDTSILPPFLTTRAWVDLRKGISDPSSFQQLINAIKGIAPGPEMPIEPRNDLCPYRGLQAFGEEHAEFFYGRNGDIQRLIEKLKSTRLLAVVGPSGSGKTSLVRAGLLPAVRKGALPGSDAWSIRVFTPGARPLTSLTANLHRLYSLGAASQTLDELSTDERALHLNTAVVLADRPSAECVVWVVDQFEEVFTLCHDEAERKMFIANMLYAALVPGGRNVVLLTMRADFYQKCVIYPELSAQVSAQQFLVSPMSFDGLRQAIQEPAWRVGLEFGPGLAETILDAVESQLGVLPLLEHALLELWERRRGRLLTLEAYQESGGVAGAMAKRADSIYESFDAEQQTIVRRVMLRLTQPGESTEDTRRRATMSELITQPDEADKVQSVVQALADARLLTTDRSENGDAQVVDVSHEALIRSWPRLRQWIEEDRQGLRVHRRLTESAQEWQRANRDESMLFRGARLTQTAEWRERNEASLNELEREFLDASAELQAKEREAAQRRTHRIVVGLVIALALISAASVYAFIQNRIATQRRTEASARELAASSLAQLPVNPELGLLLAVEAAKTAHTAEAENALRQALIKSPLYVLNGGAPNDLTDTFLTATFSPDGKRILTKDGDKAKVWDVESGRRVFELQTEGGRWDTDTTFSPDGKCILTRSADKAQVWDVESGRRVFELKAEGKWTDAKYSPDGRLIAMAVGDQAQIWESSNGSFIAKWKAQVSDERNLYLTFSPDSKFLLLDTSPLQVLDLSSGRVVAKLEGSEPTFSRDGKLVLTKGGARNPGLYVFDTKNWGAGAVIKTEWERWGSSFGTLSPDGSLVAASIGGHLAVYESNGKRLLYKDDQLELLTLAEFSPDGKVLAAASGHDGMLRLWNRTYWEDEGYRLSGVEFNEAPRVVGSISFSPDSRFVLTDADIARLYDVRSWAKRLIVELSGKRGVQVNSAEFSPDGKYIVMANEDGTVFVWDLNAWRSSVAKEFEPNDPKSIKGNYSISPDGKLFVSLDKGDSKNVVWVLDVDSGRTIHQLQHDEEVNTLSFSPDGKFIVTASGKTVKVWDANGGVLTEELQADDEVAGAWLSASYKFLLMKVKGRTQVRDLNNKSIVYEMEEGGDVISPDGKFTLSFGEKGVEVREVKTRRLIIELRGQVDEVTSASFSPDSKYVVTTSEYMEPADSGGHIPNDANEVRVWDVNSGNVIYEFKAYNEKMYSGVFSPDGKSVLAVAADGTVFIYPCEVCVPQDELLKLAEKRNLRPMTPEERARYLHESQGE